jgi:bla regulator protein blaR1
MLQKVIMRMIVFAVLAASALLAQDAKDVTGDWQGTLQGPGQTLRVVISITKADTGLKAVMHFIDQAQSAPVTSVTLQGSALKMTMNMFTATYEGTLNADGNSITGTWTQGPKPQPLNLDRATKETAWVIPPKPKAMAADANPTFEVATIKPSEPGKPGKGFGVRPGRRFVTVNTSVSDLISFAYSMHAHQIIGGPDWLTTEKYDISALADGEGEPSLKQWNTMFQKLLADRCKLTFHKDKKELTVYAIVPGKTGPKLTKSEGDPNGLPLLGLRGLGALIVRNANMADFAQLMQSTVLDRPVVDQTGLTGRFDFKLDWTPDENQFVSMGPRPAPPPDAAAPTNPDLFTAMQEQLGLRLKASKEPVDVMVLDHVEKPSAN